MAKVQFSCKTKPLNYSLTKAKHSSATETINEFDWLASFVRKARQHRLSFVFKCMHGLTYWNFNSTHSRDAHPYNTRHKDNVQMPKSRCQWGQQRLSYQVIHEWTVFQYLREIQIASIYLRSLCKLFYLDILS